MTTLENMLRPHNPYCFNLTPFLVHSICCIPFQNLIFTFSDLIMASGAYKKAFTGLTGMAVARNPTHTLGVLYRWLLIKQNTVENNLLTESIILCSLAARICVHWLRCLQTFHTGSIYHLGHLPVTVNSTTMSKCPPPSTLPF